MFGILYLLFPFSRHRIAINVTVLRCYGVTVSGGWKEGKEKVGNRGSWERTWLKHLGMAKANLCQML